MSVPVTPGVAHGGWSPLFREHLDRLLPLVGDALDLGTGTGRVALHVAPRVRRAIGVDIDGGAIQAAQEAAGRQGIRNVKFYVADAETVGFKTFNDSEPYELITAHLFLSVALLRRAFDALAPGGRLLVSGLSSNHWKQAGGSRFNLDAETVRAEAEAAGFGIEYLGLEEAVEEFPSAEAAKAHLKERRLWVKWSEDGRWDQWKSTFRREGRRLTESRLLLQARRAPAP